MNYNNRYLTKKRTPWFSIEKRDPAPIWFGVFSRGKFKIIRNTSKALCLTCYHGFVPYSIFKNYIDKLFIYFKSDIAFNCINTHRRIYGNDLTKFEPNDLSNVLVPSLKQFDNISDYFVKIQLDNISKTGKLTRDGEAELAHFLFE